jgi:uncharacterized protein (DUF2252 family)
MIRLDPGDLAARQLARDRRRTGRFRQVRGLHEHKIERMRVSPLAFLRGSAPLFYEILAAKPSLADGPAGDGWIVGDLHLENFGAFRPVGDDDAAFGVNDFDDCAIAPQRLDLLRLVTSLILGARDHALGGAWVVALADAMLDAYASGRRFAAPRSIERMIEIVSERTRWELLDARTQLEGARRHFAPRDRYPRLDAATGRAARAAFARYVKALPDADDAREDGAFDVLDVAFRVAGTGSLGALRVAVLTSGKGEKRGGWVFDMKEEDEPSVRLFSRAVAAEPKVPAARVAAGITACLAHPPRMIGVTRLGRASMFVRRLAPQEDKLDLTKVPREELVPLVRHLGALVAAAHRRGAARGPRETWSKAARTALVHSAMELAGVHEAAYLAYCRLTA